jgi:acetylornithine deacetylase
MEKSENYEIKVISNIENNKEEILLLLQNLIRIPSVTGEESEVQKFVSTKMKQMGLNVDVFEPDFTQLKKHPACSPGKKLYKDRPNVVGTYKGVGGGRSVILNAHADVVPPGDFKLWKHEPWRGEIQDGKIFGRGSSDAKSGLAAMLIALKAIIDTGLKLKGDVILQSVIEEEEGGNGTLACVLRGYKADAGIVLECTDMSIKPAARGGMWIRIIVRGKSAHAGSKQEGVSAIENAMKVYEELIRLEKERLDAKKHPLFIKIPNPVPIAICTFKSGFHPAIIPDKAVMEGTVGFLPGEHFNDVRKFIENRLKKFSEKDPILRNYPLEIKWFGICNEPSEISIDHPIVGTLKNAFKKIMGSEAEIDGLSGSADARHLVLYGDTPSIYFGPGLMETAHKVDEYVPIENVVNTTKILAVTILNWCEIK